MSQRRVNRRNRISLLPLIALLLVAVFCTDAGAQVSAPQETTKGPFRLSQAAHAPPFWTFGVQFRARAESLWNQFRANNSGNDFGLSLRTLVSTEFSFDPVFLGAELQDSRIYLVDDDTPLNTTLVNTFEPINLYLGLRGQDVFARGDRAELRVGRFTVDAGSRRLLARNAFRNTINGFTGFSSQWQRKNGSTMQLVLALPEARFPVQRAQLVKNRAQWDKVSFDRLFVASYLRSAPLFVDTRVEAGVFALREKDSDQVPTSNRNLTTFDARLVRAADRGEFDLDLEVAVQWGSSEATISPSNDAPLSHLAYFTHASLGYTFDLTWQPRLVLQYDYASGDRDPGDQKNGQFDTLYGARRFELGPTGLYGALGRSNLASPGLRIEARPMSGLDGLFVVRPAWLAQAKDQWTTAGIADPTGESGTHLGTQIEGRLRLQVLPENLELEIGFAHMWLGRFPREASAGDKPRDPSYAYLQLSCEI